MTLRFRPGTSGPMVFQVVVENGKKSAAREMGIKNGTKGGEWVVKKAHILHLRNVSLAM